MSANKNNRQPAQTVDVPDYQVKYANLLLYGSWLGIAVLAITFAMYVFGVVPAYINPADMPQYWSMQSTEYLDAVGLHGGWEWLTLLGSGDFINFLGIAFLAGLTVIGYIILLLPAFIKKKDNAFTAIVITEILVLVLAASGILGSGGH
ncbi:MAG: DUF1634 domain-containing protein [Firmicutes bacterium]|nr:DUF1634 domain-containing protein [Bacillota bacterium]